MIPEKFIEEVQSRTDIAEVVSQYVPLKKTGRNFKARCPFHSEKTPSFIVSPQKQIFHCFGCGQGGGVFQFLMQIEKINFPEAVEILAKKLGLATPYKKDKEGSLKNYCYQALEKTASFYHHILKDSKNCRPVLQYLRQRGIAGETIDTFKLGFAPGRNSLISHMRGEGFTLGVLEKASLASSAKSGFRDIFCERIIFPIFDTRNRVLGFGARLWQDKKNSPKYINSGESPVYSKRKVLFGLNLAKEYIIKEGDVVVVEGYLDMIIPFMRGIKNIVASLGTALTDEQIKLVSRFCSKATLVFDSDSAGQTAMLRTIDLLLENQIQTRVVDLPRGEDPDSIVRKKGKDYFAGFLNEAEDFFDYKLKILAKRFDPESIEGKSKIAESMLVTLDKIKSEVTKYQYFSKLSRKLGVKEEVVISEYNKKKATKTNFRKNSNLSFEPAKSAFRQRASITEKILLKSMFTHPKVLSLLKKNFTPRDFSHPLTRKSADFLFNCRLADAGSADKLLADIDDSQVSGFISRILLEDNIPQDNDSLKKSIIWLQKKRACQKKERLRQKIKEADLSGDRKRLKELISKYDRVNSEVADE